jgi:flagellar biosynthetic protein FliO
METLRVIGSLLLVFGLMGAVLWGLRRMQSRIVQAVPGRRLQIIETAGVGARQKIALVRVDGHEMLVGVSPAQITALGQWATQTSPAAQAADPDRTSESSQAVGDTYPMTAQALLERESRREP